MRRLFGRAISRGHNFARDDRGVTVIEFAILALPFFTIIFAILETAMVFFAGQVLDSAVEDASRMIKTGRAQAQGYQLTDFRTLMCGYTFGLFDCSKIKIKIDKVTSFTATNVSATPTTACNPTGPNGALVCDIAVTEEYKPGVGREIIQVVAYYRWPLTVVLPYFNLKNQPDNHRLLGAMRVFRNEPFT
jgi:Flp pilus assembly protein TadG